MSQQPSSSDHHHRSAIGFGLSLNGESPILNDIVTSTDLFNSNNRRSSQSQSSTISNSNFSCENSVPSTTSQQQQQQLSSNSFNNEIERTKENRASPTTIDITAIQHNNTSQTQPNTTDKGTTSSSWGFISSGGGGGGGGEENTLPKSSLDKVIIGSLPQQDSASSSSISVSNTTGSGGNSANSGSVIITNTKTLASNNTNSSAILIQISDKAHPPPSIRSLPEQQQPIAQLAQESTSPHSNTPAASLHNSSADSKRLRFKSLLADSVSASSATTTTTTTTTTTSTCDIGSGELNSSSPATTTVKSFSRNADRASRQQVAATSGNQISERDNKYDNDGLADKINQEEISLGTLHEEPNEGKDYISDYEDDNNESLRSHARIGQFESYITPNGSKAFSSPFRKSTYHLFGNHAFLRIQRLLSVFSSKFVVDNYRETPYVPQEGKDLLTGDQKYSPSSAGQRTKKPFGSGGRTFRGDYKYSRTGISMAIFKKLIDLLFQKSTLALIGAFLIHITLGTVYTLSNINSYLTSYMRLHGSPNLTYGGSMWISSFYAIGQGFSMVLGGYIEKRFSARLACFLGCFIHSGSIMSTSWSVNHGSLAVLMSYGFLPGFGCGLAYMTPMSNGFGWFPNRRGLVAGVILAGFGIGTFVFNIAQTAYVNPNNLSPPADSGGYFIQESILTHVPGLFLFIGTIYAAMQFVGCCLLFKPPSYLDQGKSPDERPILETEVSVGRAVRTREFVVLFLVYGIITQGVLFVNSMIKEYGQLFIGDDMYLAWTGSMASIANALGRLCWGLAIDRYSFTQCFTCITTIFGFLMFLMPFEFVLSSKQLYLICTLGIFGSFSGWMSTFPVHLSRTFGRLNSGMLYGLIFISQSFGGIASAFGAHYLIDHYSRFVPFFCVVFLEILGLAIYHLFYPRQRYL